jgi:hypothetical protein
MSTPFASGRIAIAVCQRCKFKVPYQILSSDPNYPGLRVCPDCKDQYDPYRLAPKQPDPIVMRFPRPDEPLNVPDETYIATQNDENIEVVFPDGDLSP